MRKFQKFAVILLAMLLVCSLALPAAAKDVVDMSRTGSLTVTVKLPAKLKNYGTLTLYRVADIRYDNTDDADVEGDERGYYYTPVSALAGSTLSFQDLTKKNLAKDTKTQVDKAVLAGTLTETATVNILYDATTTPSSARAEFTGLELGLYLAVQKTAASGYYKMNPFLISVPYYLAESETYAYHVTAEAKSELEKKPTETTKPGRLPQSGQLNWPVPTLAAGGMLLMAIGWVLRSKKQRENA